jgi:hypothetical protein
MIILILICLLLRILIYLLFAPVFLLVLLFDTTYKCEGSSNKGGDNGGGNNDDQIDEEEESFEIEEEIDHIDKLLELSKLAMELDEKLPKSVKEHNSYLNNLREDPFIQGYLDGDTLNSNDLLQLQEDLLEARSEKEEELSEATRRANDESLEATRHANDQSSINSLNNNNSRNLHEFDNTLNKKEDYDNYADHKLNNSLLDYIVDILKDIFN